MVNEFHLSRSAMKVHEWGFVLWLIDLTSINKKRTKILQTRKYANKTKIIIKFGQGWAWSSRSNILFDDNKRRLWISSDFV